MKRRIVFATVLCLAIVQSLRAEVRVHSTFGENMVLQRDKTLRVWGRADKNEAVTVSFNGQTKKAGADENGRWSVEIGPFKANGEPQSLTVKGTDNTITLKNILIGDVWLCGGQSNMEHELHSIYHSDVEIPSAHYPNIRLMTVPFAMSRKPEENIAPLDEWSGWNGSFKRKGYWMVCSPETVPRFCGMGYLFGRRLHMVSRIPIGIVDMSVGGTTVETWTSAESLKKVAGYDAVLADRQKQREEKRKRFDAKKDLENRVRDWTRQSEVRKRLKMPAIPQPTEPLTEPQIEQSELSVRYNGMTAPLRGMAIKGIIFNQGHNNAGRDCRPTFYANSFKAMIGDWRNVFGEDDLPFGIIAFVSGGEPQTLDNFELRMLDGAPWVREGQVAAFKDLENVGFTAAYDQQMNFYHTFNKRLLAERIARWALGTQYGIRLGYLPALLVSHEKKDNTIVLTFDRDVQQLYENRRPIVGMAIAGEDRHFYPAKARFGVKGKDRHNRDILDNRKVIVWNDLVPKPVAVRYAWARNPLGNLGNKMHHERMIPLPTFRTDNWTITFGPDADDMKGQDFRSKRHEQWNTLRKKAEAAIKKRKRLEAELLYKQTRE